MQNAWDMVQSNIIATFLPPRVKDRFLNDGTISDARRRLELLSHVGGSSCGHIGFCWYGAAIGAPNGAEYASERKGALSLRV
jgi:hypothetical protein